MRTLIVALALLLAADQGAAQSVAHPELFPGTRVRVVAPQVVEGRRIGTVEEIRATGLLMVDARSGEQLRIPFDAMTSLERSIGRSRLVAGIAGSLVGLGAGVVLGLACTAVCATDGGANLAPIGGGVVGLPIGALVGAIIAPEGWRPVYLPPGANARAPLP